ncbi:MAG: T9SS type A sorting domain-containing protein [Weeksellaceae bacterium]|nr:T9SS type A sorting domain-containing protein [Weeksellaceae bacterium]
MKKFLLASFIAFAIFVHAQVDVTATAGTASANYLSLFAAFDAINSGIHQGDIKVTITANTNEPSTALLNISTTYTSVVIKPSVPVTVTGAINTGSIIKILGSNVTIDGSATVGGTTKDLTVKNTSTSTPYVLLMGANAAAKTLTNVTIKNTTFVNGTNSAGYPVVLANGTGVAGGFFSNITFQNNEVQTGMAGIYVVGKPAGNNAGLVITGNTFTTGIRNYGAYLEGVSGGSTVSNNTITVSNSDIGTSSKVNYLIGVYLANATNNADVYGNTITGFSNSSTSTYTIPLGVYVNTGTSTSSKVHDNTISNFSTPSANSYYAGVTIAGATSNVSVYSNKIAGLQNTISANAGAGICLSSTAPGANVLVYNNFISDISGTGVTAQPMGISVYNAGSGYKIYNNTVNLSTSNPGEVGTSAALYVHSLVTAAGAIDARNNIFANNKTSGARYAIYSGAPKTVFNNLDYNDYYASGTALGYIAAADNTTLNDLQTGFGGNENSLNVMPTFASSTDLHLTAVNTELDNFGTPLADVTTDIDGEARTATPDMGADEFSSVSLAVSGASRAGISLYPNPFTDVLNISDIKGVKSISVSDMSGRQLSRTAAVNQLNLSNLRQGLYMINLQMKDGSLKSLKAIKK